MSYEHNVVQSIAGLHLQFAVVAIKVAVHKYDISVYLVLIFMSCNYVLTIGKLFSGLFELTNCMSVYTQ